MSMTDPIADMLTRIRNANCVHKEHVDMPVSRLKQQLAGVLKREGYVKDYRVIDGQPRGTLRVYLKYGPDGEYVISRIQRASRPGRRVYEKVADIQSVLGGLGITVLSTSRGLLSDREARREHVGGEVLCTVW